MALFCADDDTNWCPISNRQQNLTPSTSLKDPNYNQVTIVNDNENNQNAGADNHNSLTGSVSIVAENSHLNNENNVNQIFPPNIHTNEYPRDSEPNQIAETQSRSIANEYESIQSIENNDCEYLKLVMSFKRTLVLPDVFFSYDMAVCHCASCMSSGKNLLDGMFIFD